MITIAYADSASGTLKSSDPDDYSGVPDGMGITVDPIYPDSSICFGASYDYDPEADAAVYAWQLGYTKFTHSLPADSVVTAAYVGGGAGALLNGPIRGVRMHAYDWGATLAADDWRTPSQLSALPVLGYLGENTPSQIYLGSPTLTTQLSSSTVSIVVSSGEQDARTYDYNGWSWIDGGTGGFALALVYTTAPESTLNHVLGAQVQLSDHSWAVLESNGADVVKLRQVTTSGSAVDIATITGFSLRDSAQGIALAIDSSDSLFVVGSGEYTLMAQAFQKSGASWTAKPVYSANLPAATSRVNQVAAAWHATATAGTLVVIAAHEVGSPQSASNTDVAYAMVNCNYLLTGVGSMLRGSGSATAKGLSASLHPWVTNLPHGNGIDIAAVSATRGYITAPWPSWLDSGQPLTLDSVDALTRFRYILRTDGTGFSSTLSGYGWTTVCGASLDAAAKVRVIPIDETRQVTLSADPYSGICLEDLQNIGTGSSFTQLGYVEMDGEVGSLPAPATLASSSSWDAVYDQTANRVRIYYFDVANARRLMRTSIDLSSHLATQEEYEVNAFVGAAGSTNLAIRCSRGSNTGDKVLITVANRSSGGTLSTLYVLDEPNQTPTQPTLNQRTAFDASAAAVFTWTFTDPLPSDYQSAYRLVIDQVGGSTVYSSGKVTSGTSSKSLPAATLTNGHDYQWRVYCWDRFDVQSPASADGSFQTSDSGTVNITDPLVDNPTGLIVSRYTVAWQVTGATQAAYRVTAVRLDTSATIASTGWASGSASTYTVTGLPSDVPCRVAVTARDALAIETNTATRLLTATYSDPEVPTVSVSEGVLSSESDGPHLTVSVVNPTPAGEKPYATANNVYRRMYESGDAFVLVGQAIPNGTFDDYVVAGGVTYEYQAEATSSTGGSATSATASGGLTLTGVWLHDPQDSAGSSRQFMFRSAATSTTLSVQQVGTHYAGRAYPVFDYGDQQDATMVLKVAVPFGDTWSADLAALRELVSTRRSVVVRDARGRAMTGATSGYGEADEDWGTTVSFTVTEADTSGDT